MTSFEEIAVHDLALSLAKLTIGTGWSESQLAVIRNLMAMLAEYVPVPCARCDKQDKGPNDK